MLNHFHRSLQLAWANVRSARKNARSIWYMVEVHRLLAMLTIFFSLFRSLHSVAHHSHLTSAQFCASKESCTA